MYQYPVVIRNSYWSSWRTVGITLSYSLVFHWLLKKLMHNIIELLSRFRSVTREDFEVQWWLGYYQDFSFCDVWELEVWRLFRCQNCAVGRMGNLSLSRFITFLSPPGAACWDLDQWGAGGSRFPGVLWLLSSEGFPPSCWAAGPPEAVVPYLAPSGSTEWPTHKP